MESELRGKKPVSARLLLVSVRYRASSSDGGEAGGRAAGRGKLLSTAVHAKACV